MESLKWMRTNYESKIVWTCLNCIAPRPKPCAQLPSDLDTSTASPTATESRCSPHALRRVVLTSQFLPLRKTTERQRGWLSTSKERQIYWMIRCRYRCDTSQPSELHLAVTQSTAKMPSHPTPRSDSWRGSRNLQKNSIERTGTTQMTDLPPLKPHFWILSRLAPVCAATSSCQQIQSIVM